MFPTAHSIVYRNEAGEVLGWDNPGREDEWYDPDDYLDYDNEDEWCEQHEQHNCGEAHETAITYVSEYRNQS